MSIGTLVRGMVVAGGLGVGSAGALGAGVSVPVAISAAVDAPDPIPDAPSDSEEPAAEPESKGRSCKDHDNLGARICGWHADGLRGQGLAAKIHADHGSRGKKERHAKPDHPKR